MTFFVNYVFIHIFERIIDNSCNIREKNTIKTINNIVNKYEFFNCLISINNIPKVLVKREVNFKETCFSKKLS